MIQFMPADSRDPLIHRAEYRFSTITSPVANPDCFSPPSQNGKGCR
ncbi:MAG: hypothetical protein WBJ52_07405 [Methanoregulaceae archaeon]